MTRARLIACLAALGLIAAMPLVPRPFPAIADRPPEQFAHAPRLSRILYADPRTVDTVCRAAGAPLREGYIALACTNPVNRTVLMPDPCLFSDGYAQLLCHENAHLNGWKH